MDNPFYVYVYYHPATGVPLYVGKGKGRRYKAHLVKTKNELLRRTISKMRREGFVPRIEILTEGLTEQEAWDEETRLVKLHGRRCDGSGPLCNFTLGGEGSAGLIHSTERIAKFTHLMKTIVRTPEWRQRQSEAAKQRKWPNGFTAEHRAKMSASGKGKTISLEARKKQSVSTTGTGNSQAKRYSLEGPKSERLDVVELGRFCVERGLSYQQLRRGRIPGWRVLASRRLRDVEITKPASERA